MLPNLICKYFWVYVCVCAYVHVVCVDTCVYAFMLGPGLPSCPSSSVLHVYVACMCMQRPEVGTRSLPPPLVPLLRQSLLPSPGFAGFAGLSLSACSRIPSLHLPRDGIKGGLRHPTSFYVGPRYLDSSHLHGKFWLSPLPSPSPGFSRRSL